MGKRVTTTVKVFSGITNDPRDPSEGAAQMITNFDIFTDPRRMIPVRDSEDGDSGSSTSQKQNFCVALRTGTTYRLYGLGVVSGDNRAEVLMKDLTTGLSSDLSDSGWLTPANNQSSSGSTNFNLFVYYARTGLIYGARAGSAIWAFDPSSSAAWADTSHSLSYTNIAQGLVHSKDDVLYIAYDNKIASNNNGSWTDTALTLPSHLVINSIEERGNFLFIACAPLSGIGKSVGFYWDRDSSLATLSESVDLGEGVVKVAAEVDGELITISLAGGNSTRIKHRIIFRTVNGSQAKKFRELLSTTSPTLSIAKQKVDNRLYFLMTGTFAGAIREGLWAIGRITSTSPFAVSNERTPNNDTALGNGTLHNFIMVGDYTFISYTNNSNAKAVSKTNDQASYTATSIYEKKFIEPIGETKNVIAETVLFEPLPAAGQVVLKTRKNEQTVWSTVQTFSTDNELMLEATRLADGTKFGDHVERDRRIESTGGAVITGLMFTEEIKPDGKV